MHNEAAHVGEMLASIRSQDHMDWELLVVDDGSTDETASMVQEAAETDSRIRLLSRAKKLGKVAAFNLAFRESTGAVIAIIAGDDVLTPGALRHRVRLMENVPDAGRVAAFFKLRMFSDEPRFDGITLPRGRRGSRSGPSLTLSRGLADLLFPIPETLPSEDIWLGEAAEDLANEVIESQRVVVRYRVHSGNSNPRHRSFTDMNESIHARTAAWGELLGCDRFELSAAKRERLKSMMDAESLRYAGKGVKILVGSRIPVVDRLALVAMSTPWLFRIRTRHYKFFSGYRGR